MPKEEKEQVNDEAEDAPVEEVVTKGAAAEAKKGLKNLGSSEGTTREVDPRRAQVAMQILIKKLVEHADQVKAKAVAASAVPVSKEDVAFLSSNFYGVDAKEAERLLREVGGSRDKAIENLMSTQTAGEKGRAVKETRKRLIYA